LRFHPTLPISASGFKGATHLVRQWRAALHVRRRNSSRAKPGKPVSERLDGIWRIDHHMSLLASFDCVESHAGLWA
jgi:hypothetical protein